LSNSDKKVADGFPGKIQPHYFPDIPVETSSVNSDCASAKSSFKRIHFESGGTAGSGIPGTGEEPDSHGQSSNNAEIEEQAFQKGFLEGQGVALESQHAEVADVVQSMIRAVAEIRSLRQEIYRSIEREVVELALSIARKVVCQEIKINPEVAGCVAREALSQVDVPGKIKIRLNPADLEFITSTQGQISALQQEMDNVTFEAEEGITRGGCLIETKLGDIDARIERQFQVVEDKFRSEFARSQQLENSDENP
jgi:flagellar biosynthesis/type III secretory pathway protein FliH